MLCVGKIGGKMVGAWFPGLVELALETRALKDSQRRDLLGFEPEGPASVRGLAVPGHIIVYASDAGYYRDSGCLSSHSLIIGGDVPHDYQVYWMQERPCLLTSSAGRITAMSSSNRR